METNQPEFRDYNYNWIEDSSVLYLLKAAFNVGATIEQACGHANISPSSFHDHKAKKTEVKFGNNLYKFDDLIEIWRSDLGLKAKMKIAKEIEKSNSGTYDAWRWLERTEKEHFGLSPFQQGIDAGGMDLAKDARETIKRWSDHERPAPKQKAQKEPVAA